MSFSPSRRGLVTGAAALAAFGSLSGAEAASSLPPYSPQGQSYRPQVLCCAHGGRINTYGPGYGASGTKLTCKGRRPFYFGQVVPLAIRFVWANWYRQAVTGSTEVAGTVAIPYRASCMAIASGYTPVTVNGAVPNIPVPSAAAAGTTNGLTFSDWITPKDLGLASFTPGSRFEFRGVYDLQSGQTSVPINSATNRPAAGQSMRYAVANEGTLDVLANSGTVMTYPSGYDSIPVHMPIMVVGLMPSGSVAVFGMGDSITYNQGDFQGLGDIGYSGAPSPGGGGGYFERACFAAGVASFNAGVSGQAGAHYLSGSGYLQQLFQFHTGATFLLGTNDFFSSNQASYAPSGAASLLSALSQFCADFKGATGGGTVAVLTVPPRTTAGNNTKWTTIADQTPDSGFVSGGMADQYNAAILAGPQSYGADFVVDFGATMRDGTTPTAWKLPSTYSTTVTAAVTAGATSATVGTSTGAVVGDVLVMDPGTASVDTNGSIGNLVTAITDATTLSFTFNDVYSNTASIAYAPGSAHVINAAVKVAASCDGIHPPPRHHAAGAAALKPTLFQMARKW